MASGDIVNLNIGGKVFQTTRSTLTKYNGYFKAMFESGFTPTLDKSGCIFIDRSPKNFDFVLNFLRDGDTPIPNCELQKRQLVKEAEYYTLDGLIYLLGGDPSEEWEMENLDPTFMRDWRGAKQRGELQFTLDLEEYRDFWRYAKRKFAISICYDTDNWGDIQKSVDVRNFVKKHIGTWNILFYSFGKWTPSCYINRRNEASNPSISVETQGSQLRVRQFLERVEKEM